MAPLLDRVASYLGYEKPGEAVPVPDSTEKVPDSGEMMRALSVYDAQLMSYQRTGPPRPMLDRSITPVTLRKLSVIYPVARACINYRSSQITQLGWTVIDEKGNKGPDELLNQLRKPLFGMRFRTFLDKITDDLLTLDAVAIYKKRNRGGGVIGLMPIDSGTIRVKVTDTGEVPEPPAIAYEQIIRGQIVAQMTTDDLIYDMINPRTNSAYGLAPLESLIMQAASALRADAYNIAFLTEGNVPEGFIYLPPEIASTPEQIKQWQTWFDAFYAGDVNLMRRLKVMPGDSKYESIKKPDDMSFKEFQQWLLMVTCAVFGVPPQAIGFTYQTNRATAEVQFALGEDRGLMPLANFFKDLFDDIIVELGFPEYTFKWTTLDKKDRLREAKIAEIMIKLGVMSGDEWRAEDGRPTIGMEHMIFAKSPPIPQDMWDTMGENLGGNATTSANPNSPESDGGLSADKQAQAVAQEGAVA